MQKYILRIPDFKGCTGARIINKYFLINFAAFKRIRIFKDMIIVKLNRYGTG